MAINNILPIALGTSTSNAEYAVLLGEIYEKPSTTGLGAQLYRLVKNDSGTTLAAGDVVITKKLLGRATYKVTTTTTANHPDRCGVVGGSFGTDTIADQAYFLLHIGGLVDAKAGNITMSTTSQIWALGTATTAGCCQPVVATNTATIYDAAAVFGRLANSAVVTAISVTLPIIIEGLI